MIARHKRGGYRSLTGFIGALRRVIPKLSDEDAVDAARMIIVLAGALRTHTHQPQAVEDGYAADPSLVFLPDGFARSLERTIGLLLLGLLAD